MISRRTGNAPNSHFVPNDNEEFWDDFYLNATSSFELVAPIEHVENMVNQFFGRFGYRWHPVAAIPRYFHIGTDVHVPVGTPIYAISDGLFEYSGYAPKNGNYIVLSHPQIATEDGYVLNSLYMHCDTIAHRFSFPQKVVRKFISTKPMWVNKRISKGTAVATVGSTGVEGGYSPHLHLQLDFVSPDRSRRVSVDPMRMLGFGPEPNLTAEIRDIDEFKIFYAANRELLRPWEKFIKSYT